MQFLGRQICRWNVWYGRLAQREQKAFLAAYARQQVICKVACTRSRLTGKAISIVHLDASSRILRAFLRPFSWKASVTFWLYAIIDTVHAACQLGIERFVS